MSAVTPQRRQEFFRHWLSRNLSSECMMMDITSTSSHSAATRACLRLHNGEAGRAKIGVDHMVMFFGQRDWLPLYFSLIPDGMRDVNVVRDLRA